MEVIIMLDVCGMAHIVQHDVQRTHTHTVWHQKRVFAYRPSVPIEEPSKL